MVRGIGKPDYTAIPVAKAKANTVSNRKRTEVPRQKYI
jgi:hypothetical protein